MSLWLLIALLGLIKLPVAALMLWLPFRYDEAMQVPDAPGSADDEGGSKTLPGHSGGPHPRPRLPRAPRRGPHGSQPSPSPRRIRMSPGRQRDRVAR
jgi:hypothetical protein